MNDGISRNNMSTPTPTQDDSSTTLLPMLPMLVHPTTMTMRTCNSSASRRRQHINAMDDGRPDKKRLKKSWQPSPRKQRFDQETVLSSSPRGVNNFLVIKPLPNNDDDDNISLQFLFPQLNLKDGGRQNIYSTPQTRAGNNSSLPPTDMSCKFPSLSSLRGASKSGSKNETPIIALVPRFRPRARSSTAVSRRVTIDEEKVLDTKDHPTLLSLQGAPMTPSNDI